ncbi:MAG: hypothetical protein ACXW1W_02830 [Methylococcaceae bacterium]
MRQGQIAPRTRTGGLRARAWWVLRKNRSMTLIELQTTICNGAEKNPVANLRKWLTKLVKAGVLDVARVDDGKPTSNGSYSYTVVNNLGPKAPIVRARTGLVFDPNSNAIIKRGDDE